jgi:peptide/nickel transport system substrate-binding protein
MLRADGLHDAGGSGATQGRTIPFLVALTLAIVFLAGCRNNGTGTAGVSDGPLTLTIGYPNITGQDPLYGIQQAAGLISFEGLSLIGRDGRPRPRLAEGWAESPDGLTWRIALRANAVFHDGSPVDSAAVKRSLEQSLAGAERDLLPGLQDIVAIEAPAPREVVVRLRNRSTFLLEALSVPIVKAEQGHSPAGTGPYVTVSTSNDGITMKAFSRYYQGAPAIASVVWKPYPTVRTAWAALMRGEVDFLYEVGQDALEFVQAENSLRVFSFLRNYVYGVVFNASRPPFNDPEVRKALNYAVDRQAIVKQAFRSRGIVATGPAWPQHWAYDGSVPGYPYDPPRASALLRASGVSISTNHMQDRAAPSRLRFTCLLPENFALWEQMALMVQRNLAEIGVDMRLETMPVDAFNQHIASGDFDAVLLETIAGRNVSRPYFFWHSGSKRNFWGYHSSAVDEALDGIRYAANDQEYRNAFRRFQIGIIDDPPAIFLAWGQTVRAVSRRFEVEASPNGDVFATISTWRLADTTTRAAR